MALSNILSEIDRRCLDMAKPIPGDKIEAVTKFSRIALIAQVASIALHDYATGEGTIEQLEAVCERISKIRIPEQNSKTENNGNQSTN